MKKIFSWLSKQWEERPLITILALLLIGYLIYRLIDAQIKKRQAKNNFNAAVNQAQTAITQLAQQGIRPSYAQSQYTDWGNEIQQAFSGCGAGWLTIVKPIIQQLKNDADVYSLVQAYGTRTIDECGWGSNEGDLAAHIAYKFSGYTFCDCIPIVNCTGERCGSKSEINKILKQNGIVYQF